MHRCMHSIKKAAKCSVRCSSYKHIITYSVKRTVTLPGVYNTNSVENREEFSDSLASSLPFTRGLDPKTHELLCLGGKKFTGFVMLQMLCSSFRYSLWTNYAAYFVNRSEHSGLGRAVSGPEKNGLV